MLAIISPAKSMDFEPVKVTGASKPVFQKEATALAKILKGQSKAELKKTLSISDKLADLNVQRFKDFKGSVTEKSGKPALFAYTGDVYQGIEVDSYKKPDLSFANKHVRILSGLYGVLKPLDLIQPYRLEMGTKLKNAAGKDLYAFWTEKVTADINMSLKANKSKFLLNLASNEYVKAVDKNELVAPMVTASFKDKKDGKYKIVGVLAKRARGEMVQFLVESRAKTIADVKKFKRDGYAFNAKLSSDDELVFTRG